MLYSEFLKGTGQPENIWTHKEYERINRIYNDNENMEKEEAYALFQNPVRREDILEIEMEIIKREKFQLELTIKGLREKVSNLEGQVKAEKEWSNTYLKVMKNDLNNMIYTLEDKLGII
ncbi:MAG: hypothetical protein IJN92_09955 [Lachnospiraceae bacterium]|nr:hypothetical protein [Lachnospiraceae bacterium]